MRARGGPPAGSRGVAPRRGASPSRGTTTFTARPRVAHRGRTAHRLARLAVVLVLTAGAGLTVDVARYASAAEGRLLPGTTIAGVTVGGLAPQDARERLDGVVRDRLGRTVTVDLDGSSWTTTLAALGVTTDVDERLAQAATVAEVGWLDRARQRYLRAAPGPALELTTSDVGPGLDRWLRVLADDLDTAPVDAALDYDASGLRITPHRPGRRIDVETTRSAVLRALTAGAGDVTVRLAVQRTEPEVTVEAFDQVLFLDQSEHRLDLHLDGRLVRSYTVTTGTGRYPTPVGEFSVTAKRPRPTWVNPAPDGWGRGMPRSIGPGPNNPLGLRALNWSVGAIRFHGTSALHDLGRDASHGCVRLANRDIVELYDLVDVGARIISVR